MKSNCSRVIGIVSFCLAITVPPLSVAQVPPPPGGSATNGCAVGSASTIRATGLLESLEQITKGSDAVYDMMFSYLKNEGALGSGVFDVSNAYQSRRTTSSMPIIEQNRRARVLEISEKIGAKKKSDEVNKVVY